MVAEWLIFLHLGKGICLLIGVPKVLHSSAMFAFLERNTLISLPGYTGKCIALVHFGRFCMTAVARQHFLSLLWRGLVACVVIGIFLCAGCGTPPPDHPLTGGSGTAVAQGSSDALATGTGSIAPINIIDSQTNTSTYPGGSMTLTISTSPYALCTFVVEYGLGRPSRAAGIIPRAADANGVVNWHWWVDAGAHTGTWPLTISAILANGAKTTAQVSVQVTLPPINVISSQSSLSAYPGQSMMLTIATAPSASCNASFDFRAGKPSNNLGARSNANGIASWSWRVPQDESPGVLPLRVTVTLEDGEKLYASLSMRVL